MGKFLIKKKEFIIGFILTATLLWPLVVAPYFTHHDDVQTIRLYEMDKCIKDLQIPCRWVPDLGGLYGYPLFNYYAPLPYYFGEIIYLLSNNLILSAKLMFATAFIGSYIFMYLFAKKFWGKLGGSLSAIFYSFAPYHALDFYVRGAMAELWALMFFPAILWAMTKLEERPNIINILLSSIFLASLASSHNLSALIFLPVILVWIILLFIKSKARKFLLSAILSISLGLMLASFYLLPMIFEKNLVHVETTTFGYFGYTEHFKGLKKLFLERDWGYGSSIREIPGAEKENVSYQIGWIHIIGWFLSLVSVKFLWKNFRWLSKIILASNFIILVSIFMIHPRSIFLWKAFEFLKYIQFPWRFLLIVIFFVSFLQGSSLILIRNKKRQIFAWLAILILVVVFNFLYFKPEKFIYIADKDLLSGQNWDRLIKRSIFDFLPIYAKEPPAELAKSRFEILTGDAKVTDFQEGSNWIRFKAETSTHSIIRLSKYYFPDWKIKIDGQDASFEYKDNSLGLMTIILGKGNHTIEARLYNTPIRTIANLITGVGLLLGVSLFLISFKKIRGWLAYYRRGIS